VLAWLGWTPGDLLAHGLMMAGDLLVWLRDFFGWAWTYIRQGAVIVVPVAVIILVMRLLRHRRGPMDGV
jgi:hypothetical protein